MNRVSRTKLTLDDLLDNSINTQEISAYTETNGPSSICPLEAPNCILHEGILAPFHEATSPPHVVSCKKSSIGADSHQQKKYETDQYPPNI
ncbi:hypothetical protein Lal_00019874 [Lupinus albus]|nr:hypothetical protein Lal_00019874 [Lupinus albus]